MRDEPCESLQRPMRTFRVAPTPERWLALATGKKRLKKDHMR